MAATEEVLGKRIAMVLVCTADVNGIKMVYRVHVIRFLHNRRAPCFDYQIQIHLIHLQNASYVIITKCL